MHEHAGEGRDAFASQKMESEERPWRGLVSAADFAADAERC